MGGIVVKDFNHRESTSTRSLTQNVVRENKEQNIYDFYDVDSETVLGFGLNGEVVVCTHKATQLKYALKTLSKAQVTEEVLTFFRNELSCMACLDHPNILRVHEVFETDDTVYLVMDLCTGGHLKDRVLAQTGSFYSEKIASKYIFTILQAIAYCHANNVVHRDLKLENILFETEASDAELKIIDFGLSAFCSGHAKLHSKVGTCDYVAPEVLDGNYDAKCDVWSIGIITYALLSGHFPFFGERKRDLFANICAGNWSFDDHLMQSVSDEARDFISCCLTNDPQSRPTAAAAVQHPWFLQLRRASDTVLPSPVCLHRFGIFMIRTVLSKIFTEVVAHTLLPEMAAELRVEFNRFDVSHTGEITLDDLRSVTKHFTGLNHELITAILQNLDVNQTGKISYHEFLAATMNRKHFTELNLQLAFERISEHKEYITCANVQTLLGDAKYDIDEILLEVGMGLTRESHITFDQFMAILNGQDQAHTIVSETVLGENQDK